MLSTNLRRLMPARNIGVQESRRWELRFNANGTRISDRGQARMRWPTLGGSSSITDTSTAFPDSPGALVLSSAGSGNAYLSSDTLVHQEMGIPAFRDWTLSFDIWAVTWASGGAGRYIMSYQGATANAADTQFALVTNLSGVIVLIMSDGTTRGTTFTAPGAMAASTVYRMRLTRRGSTIALTRDGVAHGSGTHAGRINFPAPSTNPGGIRIGKPVFGAGAGFEGQLDNLILDVH